MNFLASFETPDGGELLVNYEVEIENFEPAERETYTEPGVPASWDAFLIDPTGTRHNAYDILSYRDQCRLNDMILAEHNQKDSGDY